MGNVDNVLLLLQHGANPEATTKDGYTPLHVAAKDGHEDVIGVLIDQSATPNSVTKVSARVIRLLDLRACILCLKVLIADVHV